MDSIPLMEKPVSRAQLSQLEQLKQFTRVVADSSDFESIRTYAPEDATTNPSLILKAVQKPDYADLLEKAIAEHRQGHPDQRVPLIMESLLIEFGVAILAVVPGRVSTETDARLSFDTEGLITQARRLVAAYRSRGIPPERVLVKLASTWEGIQAAKVLEREGVHCNMTLLFGLPQAVLCAEVGAKLISPFVGRILDWHKAHSGKDYPPEEDPGVLSVKQIYAYYKKHSYPTEVMGASFRNKDEVLQLAGCDLLTISPKLLGELAASSEPVTRKLSPEISEAALDLPRMVLDEKAFRWSLNEDPAATEKLAEGIRLFNADAIKLQALVEAKLAGAQ